MDAPKLLILLLLVTFEAQAKECGFIEVAQGRVDVQRAKQSVNEKDLKEAVRVRNVPFRLQCADSVITGPNSFAKIKLVSSTLTLSSNSRVQVQEEKGADSGINLLNLYYGKIRSFFNPPSDQKSKSNQTHFRIRTPTAVAGVRGTDFYVGFEPNKRLTKQATLKGSVEVTQTRTGQKVLVRNGQQVEVAAIGSKDIQSQADQTASEAAPLEVKPISPVVKEEIKQASVLAKTDEVFKSEEAIQTLGDPEDWNAKPDTDIPEDLKGIKNEF